MHTFSSSSRRLRRPSADVEVPALINGLRSSEASSSRSYNLLPARLKVACSAGRARWAMRILTTLLLLGAVPALVWHPSVLDLHLPFLERVPAAAASTIAAKRSSNNSDVRRQVVTHGAENGWQQLVEPRVVGGGASVAEAVRVTVGGLAAVAGNADYAVEVQRESQAAFEHRRQQDDGQHVRRFVNHIYKRGLAPSDLYGEPKCAASRGRWPSAPGYWFHDTGGGGRRGAQLFATAEAQRLIHEHQHPVDCAGKKFLVHSAHKAGIGSQVHMFGAALATAMSLGRIYVPVFNKHTRSAVWTEDRKYCKAGSTIDRCFLEAWTSCSVADTGYITNRNATYEELDAYSDRPRKDQHAVKTLYLKATGSADGSWGDKREVPERFKELLMASPIRKDRWVQWWRAQAATYMLRPNKRNLRRMAQIKAEIFEGREIKPGTISVHVRHGDKFKETEPVEDAVYWRLAQEALAADPTLRRRIFLSTEDPATVRYFVKAGGEADPPWEVLYTDVERREDQAMSTVDYSRVVGPSTEFLRSLVNLDLALSCEAWIGTLTSNWCRLIEELRSTVSCAADGLYLDAAQDDPPANLGRP